ncbi:MAG: GGDEF domain-containing protein [Spirochaetia bacterium]|nr:GGDEF domain-containing protein [Spirochaetia bacterium]
MIRTVIPAGDFVLKQSAFRLHECLRDVDTVGRIGGDEFVVLMDEISEPSQTIKVAERILDAMQEEINFNGTKIRIGSSIGICFAEQRHEAPKEIIRDADIALYHAKQQGRHRHSHLSGRTAGEGYSSYENRAGTTRDGFIRAALIYSISQ